MNFFIYWVYQHISFPTEIKVPFFCSKVYQKYRNMHSFDIQHDRISEIGEQNKIVLGLSKEKRRIEVSVSTDRQWYLMH